MLQKLNKPTNKYNHLKIEIWYKDEEPNKGYYIHLQKVVYNNGVYSYDLMPTEEDTRFIQLDNRKRKSYQAINKYSIKMCNKAYKITELFEDKKYKELDNYVKQNIGDVR